MDIPMLEEDEWRIVWEQLHNATLAIKADRSETGATLAETSIRSIFQPALEAYERITGFRETNHNALYHHRVALYGPPCRNCGRPLRIPDARLCGSCMAPREDA
jgi:hypothetical protein